MGLLVYIEIFKEECMFDFYVKMGEIYQFFDSYWICNYFGGFGLKQCQGDFKSLEGFYNVICSQFKFDSCFYKVINIGFLNVYDCVYGYEGKYLMIYGDCVLVGCYVMIDSGIDEIFQFVIGVLVFGQLSVQVSIYLFCMINVNMECYKYFYYVDFWKQFKSGYDYFQQIYKLLVVLVIDGCYVVSKLFSYEVVQLQLVLNYMFFEIK